MSRLGRSGGPLLAALLLLSLIVPVVLDASPAGASASGCVGSEFSMVVSCVEVRGAGTHVDWVRGGVELGARTSTRGYFDVYGDGFNFESVVETYSNDSAYRGHRKWGPTHELNRRVSDGSKVCAVFHEQRSDGSYKDHSPACVEIKG